MLPDKQHMVDIYVYSQMVRCAVLRKKDYHTMQEITVRFDKCPTWTDIVWGFTELAQKKYAADVFERARVARRTPVNPIKPWRR